MTLGVLLGFAAMISWSLSDIVTKVSLDRASKWRVIFWGQLFGGLLLLLVGFFTGSITNIFTNGLIYLLLLGFIDFSAFYGYYKAVQKKGISLITPIINSWPLVAIALGVIVYGEHVRAVQWIAAGLVLGGMVFTTTEKSSENNRIDSSFYFAFVAMLLWGVFFFLVKIPILIFGAVMTTMMIKFLTGFFAWPVVAHKKMEKTPWKVMTFIALVGILDGLGFLAFNGALTVESVSIVSPIIAAVPVLTVILGITFLKEKVTKRQVKGIVVTLIGLLLIAL
jgi:drug/metabolite transporter (DMT)-like permease